MAAINVVENERGRELPRLSPSFFINTFPLFPPKPFQTWEIRHLNCRSLFENQFPPIEKCLVLLSLCFPNAAIYDRVSQMICSYDIAFIAALLIKKCGEKINREQNGFMIFNLIFFITATTHFIIYHKSLHTRLS